MFSHQSKLFSSLKVINQLLFLIIKKHAEFTKYINFFQFLCLRNIKTFLQVCQEVFGVKEYDMFDPVVLFELSDFFKVIRTLSILSQTPKLRLHIQYVHQLLYYTFFCCVIQIVYFDYRGFVVTKPRTLSQEDIYRNINSL